MPRRLKTWVGSSCIGSYDSLVYILSLFILLTTEHNIILTLLFLLSITTHTHKQTIKGRMGPKGFKSRSMQSFQEALERGEAEHLLPVFNAKQKIARGELKEEDIPYMQRGEYNILSSQTYHMLAITK
jgi:hypothetical protein